MKPVNGGAGPALLHPYRRCGRMLARCCGPKPARYPRCGTRRSCDRARPGAACDPSLSPVRHRAALGTSGRFSPDRRRRRRARVLPHRRHADRQTGGGRQNLGWLENIPGIAGGAILGHGRVGLILDLDRVFNPQWGVQSIYAAHEPVAAPPISRTRPISAAAWRHRTSSVWPDEGEGSITARYPASSHSA